MLEPIPFAGYVEIDEMNKPVAWMRPDTLECGYGGNVDWEDTGCIPLYTHPVKELTMAEIEDFISAYGLDMGDVYEFSLAQLTKMIVEIEHQIRNGK